MANLDNPANPANPQANPELNRFTPDDKEVIQFILIPKIRNAVIARYPVADSSLSIIVSTPFGWTSELYPHFKPNEYWTYQTRTRTKPNSPRVNRNLDPFGKWKSTGGKTTILDGNTLIGLKQKFVLLKNGLKTGWRMNEFIRKSGKFQKQSVCHVVYDATDIQTMESDSEDENEQEQAEQVENEDEQGVGQGVGQEQGEQLVQEVDPEFDQEHQVNLELTL